MRRVCTAGAYQRGSASYLSNRQTSKAERAEHESPFSSSLTNAMIMGLGIRPME